MGQASSFGGNGLLRSVVVALARECRRRGGRARAGGRWHARASPASRRDERRRLWLPGEALVELEGGGGRGDLGHRGTRGCSGRSSLRPPDRRGVRLARRTLRRATWVRPVSRPAAFESPSRRRYFALPIPKRLTMIEYFSMSSRRAAAYSAGVSSTGSKPRSSNRRRTSGNRNT